MMIVNFKDIIIFQFLLTTRISLTAQQPDNIVGRWISAQRNVAVQIYKDSSAFRGRIVWFDDSDDKRRPMANRTDNNNPIKSLRNRKIIGLDVLTGLNFNIKCKCWQKGKIYDVTTGRIWNASIALDNINLVKVRGFWHYEFIGKSMTFRRLR